MNGGLFDLLRSRFPREASAPCLILKDGRTLGYGEIDTLSAKFANVLSAKGAKPGDRIAVQVEKSPQAVALYLACLRGGFVYLPLNTAYRDDELDYFLTDAEASVVVGDPASEQMRSVAARHQLAAYLTLGSGADGSLTDAAKNTVGDHAPVSRKGDDLAAILYSSGTTGKPKGVMLSNANLASNALTLHKLWQFGPNDVLLHALPIFHTHGLFVALNTSFVNGTPILFHTKFNADDVMADLPRATVMMGVPTFYVRLLANPKFGTGMCGNMRLFISGSAPLLEETFTDFERRTGFAILERYGMTEAGMITSALPDKPRRANTVGWPLPDVKLRIVTENGRDAAPGETGEIRIQGPNVFKGYWRKSEKTAEDFAGGFFKTGDLARIEPDGMVSIVGRAKDMMISGGFNVYPKEIEACIDALPGVDESAVVGLPHPDFGEAGLAVIAMKPGADVLTPEAVTAALKDALANYKIPKLIVFADTLPRNAMGKVQKKELREQYKAVWEAQISKRG